MTYKSHVIRPALPTGGKAGKGCNRTSTIQVLTTGETRLLKAFRFTVASADGRDKAIAKAKAWVDEHGVPP